MEEDVEHKMVITFKNDGSALYDIEIFGNIYAEQLFVLSTEFRYQGTRMKEDVRMAQLQATQSRENRGKILIPTPG